jgi:hypothetical protein
MVRLDSLTFSGGPFGSPFFLIAAKMSALGQKQTCALQKVMSALPPIADIRSAAIDVR